MELFSSFSFSTPVTFGMAKTIFVNSGGGGEGMGGEWMGGEGRGYYYCRPWVLTMHFYFNGHFVFVFGQFISVTLLNLLKWLEFGRTPPPPCWDSSPNMGGFLPTFPGGGNHGSSDGLFLLLLHHTSNLPGYSRKSSDSYIILLLLIFPRAFLSGELSTVRRYRSHLTAWSLWTVGGGGGGLKKKKCSKFYHCLKLFALLYIKNGGEICSPKQLLISWAHIGFKNIRTTVLRQ